MKPLAYGYMRVSSDVDDHVVRELEQRIRRFAQERGFCFAAIFYEFTPGSHEAFDELTSELQRADAHHVIVPSFSHLAINSILRESMRDRLEHNAGAKVLELSEC